MKTRKIIIDPQQLKLADNPCVTTEALKILTDKKISLEFDVFESEQETSTKSTIVFVHGNSSSKRAFSHLLPLFTNRYRVVAYDLLGHGDSTKIGGLKHLTPNEIDVLCSSLYSPSTMIAQSIQLFNTLKITQAHILAWSLAGHLFYGVAIEKPSLVASLTTIGSPPVFFKTSAFKQGFHDFFTETLLPAWINTPKSYTKPEASQISLSVGFQSHDLSAVEDLINTDPLVRKFLFVKEESNKALDALGFISTTTIPLCLMVGSKDVGIKFEYIENCKTKLKNPISKVEIIPNASHAIFASNVEEFLKVFEAFLLSYQTANRVKNSSTNAHITDSGKKMQAETLPQFTASQQPLVASTNTDLQNTSTTKQAAHAKQNK
jgi:pimeloyl-ACP methyl ester carboxylesterase